MAPASATQARDPRDPNLTPSPLPGTASALAPEPFSRLRSSSQPGPGSEAGPLASALMFALSWLFRRADGRLRLTSLGAAALLVLIPLCFWLSSRELAAEQAKIQATTAAEFAWKSKVDKHIAVTDQAFSEQAFQNLRVTTRLDSLQNSADEHRAYLQALLVARGIDPAVVRAEAASRPEIAPPSPRRAHTAPVAKGTPGLVPVPVPVPAPIP